MYTGSPSAQEGLAIRTVELSSHRTQVVPRQVSCVGMALDHRTLTAGAVIRHSGRTVGHGHALRARRRDRVVTSTSLVGTIGRMDGRYGSGRHWPYRTMADGRARHMPGALRTRGVWAAGEHRVPGGTLGGRGHAYGIRATAGLQNWAAKPGSKNHLPRLC
jgi:hypothetical protein